MLSIIIPDNLSSHINLYSSKNEADDFSMIKLCKLAIEHHFSSITIPFSQVDNVWKWLEFSNISLIGYINMFNNPLKPNDLFRIIKKNIENGADMTEVILPLYSFDLNLDKSNSILYQYLDVIHEAKVFSPIKIVLETGYIDSIAQINKLIDLFSSFQFDYIKTSSSFHSKYSSLNHLFLFLKHNLYQNFNIDFLFNPNSNNPFIIQDAFRLAENLNIPSLDNLIFSIPFSII